MVYNNAAICKGYHAAFLKKILSSPMKMYFILLELFLKNKLIKHTYLQLERRHTTQSILNRKVCDARDGGLMSDIPQIFLPCKNQKHAL